MTRRRRHASHRLASQAFELAVAAPQVAAHRIARMAAGGASPSSRDQAEFMRMGTEKVFAFYESWAAMWASACTAQMQFAQQMTSGALAGMLGRRITLPDPMWIVEAGTRLSAAGLAPVHRKARANAKRLSRRRP